MTFKADHGFPSSNPWTVGSEKPGLVAHIYQKVHCSLFTQLVHRLIFAIVLVTRNCTPESFFSVASGLTTGRASCLFIEISGPLLAALWFTMIHYVHQCQLWETSVFGDVDISVFVDLAVCWQTTMRLKFSFFLNRKLPNLSQQLQMLKCYSIYLWGILPWTVSFWCHPKAL